MHTYSLFISVIEKRDQQVQVNVFWCRTFTVKSQFTDDHFHFLKQVLNLSEKWILPSIPIPPSKSGLTDGRTYTDAETHATINHYIFFITVKRGGSNVSTFWDLVHLFIFHLLCSECLVSRLSNQQSKFFFFIERYIPFYYIHST